MRLSRVILAARIPAIDEGREAAALVSVMVPGPAADAVAVTPATEASVMAAPMRAVVSRRMVVKLLCFV